MEEENEFDLAAYIEQVDLMKKQANVLPENNPASLQEKIELLTQCHELSGEISSECDRLYKRIHVQRDMDYAEAYISAKAPKKERAELATREIRVLEAESYGRSMKWRNEFKSLQENIHTLKLKMKVNFADGTMYSNSYQR
ncbi:hypothetical protein MHH60_30670 [Paenibacillus sp. FSL H7-0716]|uniref:Uncharacterized protein n=1 Tax=Paenibacillus odorifer TaxID=189426 RepID=A0AB36JDK2_9BACL|nr:hypothetical protein [Paenibacillus odorifer]OME19534.1 hypothetical protein BSK47_15980 [Paenibacillus odorifer]